jgi:ferrous iron transport protein A
MSVPLSRLQYGASATVSRLLVDGSIRQRLCDLGFTPGASIERMLDSPAGDPICFRIRGTMVALRATDAARVIVEI